VMLPATFGMIVLAKPLYTMFYAPDALGVSVLIQACFAGLFMGLYMLSSTMLMGMYENKAAIKYFGLGLALKLIVQYPSVRLFEVYGPLIATMIGFTLSCVLIMRKIKKVSHFNFGLTLRRGLLIFLITLIMMIGAIIMRQFLYLFLDPTRKFQSFVIIMIVASFGGAIYGYITLKLRLADKLLGASVGKIRRKLKIK